MTDTNKQIVRSYLENIDRADFDAARALAPEMAAYFNGNSNPMNAAQHEGMVRGILKSFTNTRHIILSQVSDGEWVATRRDWAGVHSGDFQGVPASNRSFQVCTTSFDRVVNGKIVEHHGLMDMASLMAQLGAGKK